MEEKRSILRALTKNMPSRAFSLPDKTRVALSGVLGIQLKRWGCFGEFNFGKRVERRNPLSPRALALAARRKLLSASFRLIDLIFFYKLLRLPMLVLATSDAASGKKKSGNDWVKFDTELPFPNSQTCNLLKIIW